jgi:protein TonB
MKDDLRKVSGFDELVFENRNREYGAYLLRKRYNATVIISLIAAIIIACSVVIIPFLNILGKQHQAGSAVMMRYVQVQMDKMEPPEDKLFVIPPPSLPPANSQPSIKYVAPIVVDSVPPTEKPQPTVAEVQESPQDNNQLVAASGGDQDDIIGQEGGESEEPFIFVEVNPTFKGGGIEKFREWIQRRTIYPQQAQDNGIKGRVYLTFVVERDGSVSNVKIVKGVDKLIDDEAVKAIEASPKWNPGLQRGRPVRVRFSIFLNFTMD